MDFYICDWHVKTYHAMDILVELSMEQQEKVEKESSKDMQDEQKFPNGKARQGILERITKKRKTKIYDLKVGGRLKDILHKLRNLEFYQLEW